MHILAFESDSKVVWFECNFTDYEEAKRKRLGDIEPKRVRYKKLG
jgi:energy-dependent translational throttle protein EttA